MLAAAVIPAPDIRKNSQPSLFASSKFPLLKFFYVLF
jgi:hypothetical protein